MDTKQVKKSSVKASSSQPQKTMIPLSEVDLAQISGGWGNGITVSDSLTIVKGDNA